MSLSCKCLPIPRTLLSAPLEGPGWKGSPGRSVELHPITVPTEKAVEKWKAAVLRMSPDLPCPLATSSPASSWSHQIFGFLFNRLLSCLLLPSSLGKSSFPLPSILPRGYFAGVPVQHVREPFRGRELALCLAPAHLPAFANSSHQKAAERYFFSMNMKMQTQQNGPG